MEMEMKFLYKSQTYWPEHVKNSDHDIARDFDHAWNDKDDDDHARKEI